MGADLVHVQYSLSPLAGPRAVTTVHDVSFLIGPQWFRPRDRLIMRASVPAACRRANRVIAVSHTFQKEIEQLIPAAKGKVRTVYNACPGWIEATDRSAARQFVSSRLGIDGPFLLSVGTRWPRKNMKLAVDAADLLPSALPHRLVLTGKAGWGDAELGRRGLATGYVDAKALSALYSAADLYLAPSRHEGFGIPLLEAFRCGCPVLCSTGGALPEIAGDAAEVEPTWAADHWAGTIQSLLSDPNKLDSLRSRGAERERGFSWDEAARQTLEVYRETLKETAKTLR